MARRGRATTRDGGGRGERCERRLSELEGVGQHSATDILQTAPVMFCPSLSVPLPINGSNPGYLIRSGTFILGAFLRFAGDSL